MPIALITGPTSGLGRAFAEQLAAGGHDLVLVSRDAERLNATAVELAQRHGVATEALPADLSTVEGMAVVEERLRENARPVDLLVNNAGFALRRPFVATDIADEERLQNVFIIATLRLTRAALDGMLERKHGAIVTVSSLAGWIPRGTYGAAKAWQTSFTEGLASALYGTGVRAMALLPGFVRTEFHQRARMRMDGIPGFMWLEADDVVRAALRDLRKGKVVSVPGAVYKPIGWVLPRLPRRLLVSVGRRHPSSRRR